MHPSPHESDWTDGDWTGAHTKSQKPVGETNLLLDWDSLSHQHNTDSKPDVDKINMNKLSLGHDNPQEEPIYNGQREESYNRREDGCCDNIPTRGRKI